jgi:hypothetical protein
MPPSYSPLARRVPGVRDPKLIKNRKPWGVMLHTTGGGVTSKARKEGKTPLDVALEIYIKAQNGSNGYFWGGPNYVIDLDGSIHQIAPDEAQTEHGGGLNREAYRSGSWTSRVSPETVRQWRRQWPGIEHPYKLFPSFSPNTDFIGVEMIPIGNGFGGPPMAPGLRFSRKQHDAAIALGRDLANRFGWPADWASTRLLGHEDVDPIERYDPKGGWDPGWLREAPYFDFDYVRRALGGRERGIERGPEAAVARGRGGVSLPVMIGVGAGLLALGILAVTAGGDEAI